MSNVIAWALLILAPVGFFGGLSYTAHRDGVSWGQIGRFWSSVIGIGAIVLALGRAIDTVTY